MTDIPSRLEAIRQREQALPESDWRVDSWTDETGEEIYAVKAHVDRFSKDGEYNVSIARYLTDETAEYIASARSDVPWLLSLVEDVGEALAALYGEEIDELLNRVEGRRFEGQAETLAALRDAALQAEGDDGE